MSPMPAMPKSTVEATTAFLALVPKDPALTTRPMFGNMAAFINGNMFAGLFGDDLFVRLPDVERAKVKQQGGKDFEPMPGRAMTGYVCVAATWRAGPAPARAAIAQALTWTRQMPAKKPTAGKAEAKTHPPPRPSVSTGKPRKNS
ncbi:MAG TPA: TfoX/Sxy family protein [Candidatus Dormibacteraeota bacterium]